MTVPVLDSTPIVLHKRDTYY